MLEIINTYNNGFVAIPVIIACKKRGFFNLLARERHHRAKTGKLYVKAESLAQ